jgi:fatty acid desaturase
MSLSSNKQSDARNDGAAQSGEQFRDDLRCARDRVLPAEELRELTVLSTGRSVVAVARTVLLIVTVLVLTVLVVTAPDGTTPVAAWSWSWSTSWSNSWSWLWVVIPAIIIIATQQHALFVLAHEAAHYRLFPNRRVNDLVGRLLSATVGLSMCSYRVVHRLHHNHLYGDQDPDIALHGGYPRGKAYLLRKLASDALGLTAWKTYRYFLGSPAANANTGVAQRPLDDTLPALRRAARDDRWLVAGVQLGMPVCVVMLFGWQGFAMYLLLWVVPAFTVLQAILRVRAICEHGAPSGYESALKAARTTIAGPVLRFVLFPHHVNYHIEHHLYPAVPHYNLPALHTRLKQRGILGGAEVRSFAATWRRVFAAPVIS